MLWHAPVRRTPHLGGYQGNGRDSSPRGTQSERSFNETLAIAGISVGRRVQPQHGIAVTESPTDGQTIRGIHQGIPQWAFHLTGFQPRR